MVGRLIIFTRYPEPGRVKTRLIPALGPVGAADVHHRLTALTLAWARALQDREPIRVEVHFDGGDAERMQARFGKGFVYQPQAEGDLGEKLIAALANTAEPTIVVGTDCPSMSAERALRAIASLSAYDVVLGPSSDGGYYLIGLNRPEPCLFTGIAWSTVEVCGRTQQIAAEHELAVALLDVLDDVDRPEDLAMLDPRLASLSRRYEGVTAPLE